MATDTKTTEQAGPGEACDICVKYPAAWVRVSADPEAPADPVRVCTTHKKHSQSIDRRGTRWQYLPIRRDPALVAAGHVPSTSTAEQPALLAYPLDGARGHVGKGHPDTAKAMQAKALPRSGSFRRDLAALVVKLGGATDYELEAATGRSHQSVSGCRNGLVADGWLESAGITRPNQFGNEATVWVATRLLREMLR